MKRVGGKKMVNLDLICKTVFKDKVKVKDLREFEETTPNGNQIQGYISTKPNHFLGSCVITALNNEHCNQFIQSMPKIHYYQHHTDISKTNENISFCYEKLDGTCLILYPLKNKNGEIIEIIPKTRGRAVADAHFIELYEKIDKKPIQKYYENHDGILIFELYGILNQHEIIHYDTGIDIRLIAIYENNQFINNINKAKNYGFKLPDCLFKFNCEYRDEEGFYFTLEPSSIKYKIYQNLHDITHYKNGEELNNALIAYLEDLNKNFYELNGRLAIEGVVINTVDSKGFKKWLKVKPREIMNKHRSEHGIPKKDITKECLKYFDEYGSQVKEIYESDKKHHTEYLHRMLNEEYSEDMILKSKNKIEKIFMQIWDNKQVPTSIHNICDELINDYGDKGITYCMRMFSELYPMKKKDARMVYSTLETKFHRNNMEL